MFQSPWLDRFTRVHPIVPVLIYAPAICLLFAFGAGRTGLWNAVALVMGGYAVWTLTEYWLHRVVFHFEPERGLGAKLHWMIHGVHHDHPNDPLRLVMPPSASVPLAAIFAGVFWLALGGNGSRRSWRASWPGTWPTTWSTTTCTTTGRGPASDGGCANCTCATTSRTTSAGSGSAPRTGITSSGRRR